ncbi:hypothetical protein QVD17_22226 [Tagetes erecta]|uniref:C2H2-type domain-containing protein n=1 Tax=Tagetes erecta TaxID=13708 RepID=A0AAD8NTI2_TARER|nr:hypothetical protein QVD17_22226 [Tagetes erecta]
MLNHNDLQPSYSVEHDDDDEAELQDVRSYECTYCKHGFTNAQALGGHMNVHRKEKLAKTTRANNTSDSCLITSSIYDYDHKQEIMKTREFVLGSNPDHVVYHNNINLSKDQNPINGIINAGPSREEMRLSLNLSLQFDQSHKEDEVDLELRL